MVNFVSDWLNKNIYGDSDCLKSVMIYSDSDANECFGVVLDVVSKHFKNKAFVLQVIGLPENLKDVMMDIVSDNMLYSKGDADKFFIRKFPEYIAVIDDQQLSMFFGNYWSNAIYERRYVYVLEKQNVSYFMNALKKNMHSKSMPVNKQVDCIDAIIENVPEFGSEGAFVLSCREALWKMIWPIIEKRTY